MLYTYVYKRDLLTYKRDLLTYKRDLLTYKRDLLTYKRDLLTYKHICIHTYMDFDVVNVLERKCTILLFDVVNILEHIETSKYTRDILEH